MTILGFLIPLKISCLLDMISLGNLKLSVRMTKKLEPYSLLRSKSITLKPP